MSSSIRAAVAQYGLDQLYLAAAHPGLWFDRYLAGQPARGEALTPYNDLISQVCAMKEPPLYARAFDRWQEALAELGVQPIVARATYRLAAGHGRESVIETGLALHHTWGVPYIPGSSLKGVAAAYAARHLAEWSKEGRAHKALFGTQTLAGYVTFFDALPLPGTWKLLHDTITVHHPGYYQGGDPPADWDDPTPIPFLTATGDFLIAVHAPGADEGGWAGAAYGILALALAEEGVGGKTSSSYGRFDMTEGLHQ